MDDDERVKYFKEWMKQDFVNSGIGTGNLNMDQELTLFLSFLRDVYNFSILRKNDKLCDKVMEDRKKIFEVLDKRIAVDKELSDLLQVVVDYYMKL